jgi:hypothetical protein
MTYYMPILFSYFKLFLFYFFSTTLFFTYSYLLRKMSNIGLISKYILPIGTMTHALKRLHLQTPCYDLLVLFPLAGGISHFCCIGC